MKFRWKGLEINQLASKVAGTSCIAVISFQVFGPGSALGTKGTWTDLRRKLLKPQQRFYVIALLLRGPCFEKSVCCSVFFNGRFSHSAMAYSREDVFPCTFPSQNIVKSNSKYLFSGAWKGRDKERTDLHRSSISQGLSPPVQCQQAQQASREFHKLHF